MPPAAGVKWVCGLTTVPSRRTTLLPRTLGSVARAGFPKPRLVVDGGTDSASWEEEFECGVTLRSGPPVRTFGNWVAGLWELYAREPFADRYAMFQDDFVTTAGLREYLDRCKYPGERTRDPARSRREARGVPPRLAQLDGKGYWNLYTFPSNQKIAPRGFHGWYYGNQLGRGAVALVFNREAVIALLGSAHMVERPTSGDRGWKSIDGGIVTALAKAGWGEYVHTPSLVQHTGEVSSMGSNPQPLAPTFPGERFDARSLCDTKEWRAEPETSPPAGG